MLTIFDEVAMSAILIYYPAYERIHSEVHVRITDLPTTASLRELRRSNLNKLVRVAGVVTRRTGVFPQLKYVKFDCQMRCYPRSVLPRLDKGGEDQLLPELRG